MDGAQKFKMRYVMQPSPFWGYFVVHRLRLATINLFTKCEVYLCSQTMKIQNVMQNGEIGVVWGVCMVISNITI